MIVEIVTKSGRVMEVHAFQKNHITIGRAYSNDMILQDPYMEAEHLDVNFDEDQRQFVVRDLNSLNGSALQKPHQKLNADDRVWIPSGQQVTVGKTTLRFLDKKHAAHPALPLSAMEPFYTLLSRWWVTVAAVLCCVGMTLLSAYQKDPFSKTVLEELNLVVMITIAAIFYSGLWMLLARLQRSEGRLLLNMNLFLLLMVIDGGLQLLVPAYDFNLGWLVSVTYFTLVISFLLVAAMIYISTTQSTHLPRWSALSIAGVLGFLVIMSDVFQLLFPAEFSVAPPYNMTLVPPAQQWRRGIDESAFLTLIEQVYVTSEVPPEG